MSATALIADVPCPQTLNNLGTAGPAYSSMLVDAAGEMAAAVFRAPKTGNIRKIYFQTRTVSTGAAVDVRVETVSASDGNPTGTLWGTNTNVTHTINNSDDNVMLNCTLTADAAVTRGDIMAVVIVNNAGTPGNFNIGNTSMENADFPYTDLFAGGAWTKSANAPVLALEYDDGSYAIVKGVYPFSALNTTSYNSGSTPDERGLKFRFPVPVKASGFWVYCDLDGDATIKVYDSDGSTELASVALDKDIRRATTYGKLTGVFPSDLTFLANTYYRMTLLPGGTTIALGDFDVATAAQMGSMSWGTNFHHTQRTDAGAWTDTTTKRPFMGLIVSHADDGAGGTTNVTIVQRRRRTRTFIRYHRRRMRSGAPLAPGQIVFTSVFVQRQRVMRPAAQVRKRRIFAIGLGASAPTIVLTNLVVHRRRRMTFHTRSIIRKLKGIVQVNQTFVNLVVNRRIRRTAPAVIIQKVRPIVPQAAVTFTTTLLVHRRRRMHQIHLAFVNRRRTTVNNTFFVPRRRHVIKVPPAVLVHKRRVTFPVQQISTSLVISRQRKVR